MAAVGGFSRGCAVGGPRRPVEAPAGRGTRPGRAVVREQPQTGRIVASSAGRQGRRTQRQAGRRSVRRRGPGSGRRSGGKGPALARVGAAGRGRARSLADRIREGAGRAREGLPVASPRRRLEQVHGEPSDAVGRHSGVPAADARTKCPTATFPLRSPRMLARASTRLARVVSGFRAPAAMPLRCVHMITCRAAEAEGCSRSGEAGIAVPRRRQPRLRRLRRPAAAPWPSDRPRTASRWKSRALPTRGPCP